MGMKSRRKGKEGELAVARLLYKAHYNHDPPPDRSVFVRTKPGVRQEKGDIVFPDDFAIWGKGFYAEVKNRQFCLPQLAHSSELHKMIEKAYSEAQKQNLFLLFIFKSHREWWVITDLITPGWWIIYLPPEQIFSMTTLASFCNWWKETKERWRDK